MLRKLSANYQYSRTRDELLAGSNVHAHSEINGKASKPIVGRSLETGLKRIKKDAGRGLLLNGEEYAADDITPKNMELWFPNGHHENLLINYSQDCAQVAVKIVTGGVIDLPSRASLTDLASQSVSQTAIIPDATHFQAKSNFCYDSETDAVYCEVISQMQVGLLPGAQTQAGVIELYSRFRLLAPDEKPDQSIRFDLEEIRTNSELAYNMLVADSSTVLTDPMHPLRGSFSELPGKEEEQPQKKDVSSRWKIAAGVAIFLGMAAIVAGAIFFPPSMALTLPYAGTVFSASPFVFAGAALIGVTALGQLTQQAITSERFKQKWDRVPLFWKIAAGVTIGLSIAAVIAGAVFFPPTLVFTAPFVGSLLAPAVAIYGGLGLALITGLGHLLHIGLKSVPDEQKWDRPEIGSFSNIDPSADRKSSLSSTASSTLGMRNEPPTDRKVVGASSRAKVATTRPSSLAGSEHTHFAKKSEATLAGEPDQNAPRPRRRRRSSSPRRGSTSD